MIRPAFVMLLWSIAATGNAQSPKAILDFYSQQAAASQTGFAASATRGEELYRATLSGRGNKPASCTSCHTDDPKATGKTQVYKPIKALAPAANADRLIDPAKTEKWFRRGCNDVLDRECTAQEKADFVRFLLSVK